MYKTKVIFSVLILILFVSINVVAEESSPTVTTEYVGNQAMSFDGVSHYGFINNFRLGAESNGTYEFLFSIDTKMSGEMTLLTLAGENGVRLEARLDDGQYGLIVGNGINYYKYNKDFKVGLWYHVAISWSSTQIKTYINGKEVLSTSSGVRSSDSANLYLGVNNSGSIFFKGKIDDLRIWSVDRGVDQIKAYLLNNSAEVGGLYYSFDQKDSSIVKPDNKLHEEGELISLAGITLEDRASLQESYRSTDDQ